MYRGHWLTDWALEDANRIGAHAKDKNDVNGWDTMSAQSYKLKALARPTKTQDGARHCRSNYCYWDRDSCIADFLADVNTSVKSVCKVRSKS